jgi:pimeloyl-ACP methyl ester carboxylesterase/catechol 2,3-dioxygenase-like lactoylglutathione lyase family enzyme
MTMNAFRWAPVVLTIFFGAAVSQPTTQETKAQPSGQGPPLTYTCLITKDLKQLTEFYERVLQMKAITPADRYVEFPTSAGTLAIFDADAQEKYIPGSAQAGLNKSAILEFNVADVDQEYARLQGIVKTWVKPPTTQSWGNRSIYFRDPDGNLVDFFTRVKLVPYGTNDQAGHYVQTPDAKLYYERYGEGGQPIVFLHGGEYGYIDEFAEVIRQVSKQRTVIAIATRGYGRSERGTRPLSHRQFAEDAALIIKDIFKSGEKVDVMGFSEGAITSYILASSHPELVRRLVAIGGPLGAYGASIEDLESDEEVTPELMQQQVPDLVARRKTQMTHPEQWDQLIRDLNVMYDRMVYVKQAEIRAIKAPTLIMAGDKDETRPDHFVEIFKLLPNAQMAIIPGCGHVIFRCKPDLSIKLMLDFLQ